MDARTDLLLEDLCFTEGPRWRGDRLWFSDMYGPWVMSVDLSGDARRELEVPAQPSGLGWLPDGRLLVVSMTDRRVLRREQGGETVLHADLSQIATWHCNDMVSDAHGRCYVGNFGSDYEKGGSPTPAALALVTPEGDARAVASGLRFPNGSVITPDGGTLVVGESFGACLTAFDIEEDGSLSNRRTFAKLEGAVPDGICLDAEGAVWVASPLGNEVLRVREGGEVTHRVACSRNAIACMLGGPERRHLFVCTSTSTRRELCLADRPARIELARVDVPGAGFP